MIENEEKVISAIKILFYNADCLTLKTINKRLRRSYKIHCKPDCLLKILQKLVLDSVINVTPGDRYCMPKNYQTVRNIELKQSIVGNHAKNEKIIKIPPSNSERLLRTITTNIYKFRKTEKCQKCNNTIVMAFFVTNTSWGDIILCDKCKDEVMAQPVPKPKMPRIHFISAPIGSGKRR